MLRSGAATKTHQVAVCRGSYVNTQGAGGLAELKFEYEIKIARRRMLIAVASTNWPDTFCVRTFLDSELTS